MKKLPEETGALDLQIFPPASWLLRANKGHDYRHATSQRSVPTQRQEGVNLIETLLACVGKLKGKTTQRNA